MNVISFLILHAVCLVLVLLHRGLRKKVEALTDKVSQLEKGEG